MTPTKVDAEVAAMQKPYTGMAFDITVDRIEPERLFSFRWHPFAIEPGIDYSKEPSTLVVFELTKVEGGTLLTITVWLRRHPSRATRQGVHRERGRLGKADAAHREVRAASCDVATLFVRGKAPAALDHAPHGRRGGVAPGGDEASSRTRQRRSREGLPGRNRSG
jgi:hypothetical protein